ncbi:hypothetical protein CRYUN_Cryun26dG0014300 [Craigia yunnanensis]
MEFKFRAVDNRPPNHFSFSSSSFNSLSGQGFRPHPNFNRPDPIQWELEKAQIREEIIASEIVRRRALEAEVRRELMAEWEMAARHRARETGLSFEHRLTMRLDHRLPFMHHFNNNHHRWRLQERSNFLPPPLPMLPPRVTDVLDTEVKGTSEGNKNKLIIMAKPNPNYVVGAKRKTPPPAGAGELPLPLISLKRKPNEEWSCAICQVSVTSEKGLTEHIQGRKHKVNEARLKAQRMEKNSNATTWPKKPRQHANAAEMPVTTGLGSETETEEKLPQLSKNVDSSDQKLEDREKLKNKKDELLIKREKKAERSRKKLNSLLKKHGPSVDKVERTPELGKKKKYEFWCQICLVGVHSEVVMETHVKGRRHIARLRELDKNNAAAPAPSTTNSH